MIIPNLMVGDICASAAFYRDILGFSVLFSVSADKESRFGADAPQPGDVFAIVEHDGAQLMLQTAASLAEELPQFTADMAPTVSGAIYIRDMDPDTVRTKIPDNHIIKDTETSWYGMKELFLTDPDGYVLTIGIQDPATTPPA